MARIKAPADLPELVKAAFAKARTDGDLHYFATQATVLRANSIPVCWIRRQCLNFLPTNVSVAFITVDSASLFPSAGEQAQGPPSRPIQALQARRSLREPAISPAAH
jgi:hypothetical protein